MASVADRRATVVAFALAVELQKGVLQAMEKMKSDAQTGLNGVLDPIARLPLEISSDIFTRCLFDDYITIPELKIAPLLFMSVCRSWNQIAVSTPALWATLHIAMDIPRPRGFEYGALAKLWLDRAKNQPLRIALDGPLVQDVRDLVHQKAHQVQTLVLFLQTLQDLLHITTPLPSLQALTIGQSRESGQPPMYYADDADACVELLRAAPGLVDCTFEGIMYEADTDLDHHPASQLTHSSLETLRLGGRHYLSSTLILKSLTLPALKVLTVAPLTIRYDDLLGFLTRSSPPLQSLEMQLGIGVEWSHDMLEGIFWLVPSLTDLHLTFTTPISPLLGVLTIGSPQFQFLPGLSNLEIRITVDPSRSEYETLVRTLSARRGSHARMQSFRLFWWAGAEHHEPDADILVAVRQLVADGMEIYMGTSYGSYV
ncbi:hypothetical protein B0H17DRAFT_512251 [Mycena rosella]|uniref:F-box domain-containing protein n=1 Tax=Mycena rosella TaxID=1033263 RepID=A0AAD7DJF7_MYCRO|nr:hypothetical protein B0H17DRAFT_512251 [Mycena rosella]